MYFARRLLVGALLAIAPSAACASPPQRSAGDAGAGATADPAPSLGGAPVDDPLGVSDASVPSRVAAVFRGCGGGPEAACHGSGAAHLYLRIDADGGDVVGVPSVERPELLRVQPFDPEASYLYLKVLGDGGIEGGRMPLSATSYSQRLPALVAEWIRSGAPSP